MRRGRPEPVRLSEDGHMVDRGVRADGVGDFAVPDGLGGFRLVVAIAKVGRLVVRGV
jgi:hypothetical protein